MDLLSSLEMTFSIEREILPVCAGRAEEGAGGDGLIWSVWSCQSEIFGNSTVWRGSLDFTVSFTAGERLGWKGSSDGSVADILSIFDWRRLRRFLQEPE